MITLLMRVKVLQRNNANVNFYQCVNSFGLHYVMETLHCLLDDSRKKRKRLAEAIIMEFLASNFTSFIYVKLINKVWNYFVTKIELIGPCKSYFMISKISCLKYVDSFFQNNNFNYLTIFIPQIYLIQSYVLIKQDLNPQPFGWGVSHTKI